MTDALAKRIRNYLSSPDSPDVPITYQMLTIAMDLVPPNTIHRVTVALEYLIEQDADAGQPLIATFVISKARDGLPASGFFYCAQRVGRFHGDPEGVDAEPFYAAEFERARAFWRPDT